MFPAVLMYSSFGAIQAELLTKLLKKT